MRALVAALALAALPAAAQQTKFQLACGDAREIAALLAADGQAIVATAKSNSGMPAEVWIARDGHAYALIFRTVAEDGRPLRCLVDMGTDIEAAPPGAPS